MVGNIHDLSSVCQDIVWLRVFKCQEGELLGVNVLEERVA